MSNKYVLISPKINNCDALQHSRVSSVELLRLETAYFKNMCVRKMYCAMLCGLLRNYGVDFVVNKGAFFYAYAYKMYTCRLCTG